MSARRIPYPERMGLRRKKIFKDEHLRAHPDTLFYDTTNDNVICDLIFFTTFKEDWIAAIKQRYPRTDRIQLEDKIKLDLHSGTVCVYPSGKIVIQASPEDRTEFDKKFDQLRKDMEDIKLNRQMEQMSLGNTGGHQDPAP